MSEPFSNFSVLFRHQIILSPNYLSSNYLVFPQIILSPNDFVTKLFCHQIILSLNYFVSRLFCYQIILSPNHFVTKLFCHQIILLPNNFVTKLFCHQIMQTECFTILLLAFLANTFASDDEQVIFCYISAMLSNMYIPMNFLMIQSVLFSTAIKGLLLNLVHGKYFQSRRTLMTKDAKKHTQKTTEKQKKRNWGSKIQILNILPSG